MTTLDELETIYPSLILSKPGQTDYSFDYEWFQTPEKDTIGIKKEEIEERDSKLLSLFLTPLSIDRQYSTNRESAWGQYLNGNTLSLSVNQPIKYRFVFFSIADQEADKDTLQEAFQSLFPRAMPLLWQTNFEGFIIEEVLTNDQDAISFESIIDVLMSDFYTKIRFYISEFSERISEAPSLFKWANHCHDIAGKYQISPVVTYMDIVPYLYINALPDRDWQQIHQSFFSEVENDKELLKTIRVFLESGSNASMAAKQLYMHRNSLQYRVDKFIEKTGIDVKKFEGAVMTFLALLAIDQ